MRSSSFALCTEFWHRGWLAFVGGTGASIALLLFIYGIIKWNVGFLFENEVGHQLHFSCYLSVLLGVIAIVLSSNHTLERFFPLPITTRWLVTWKMMTGMIAAGAMYWIVASAINLMVGARWPILGPTMLTIAVVAWAQFLAWVSRNCQITRVLIGFASTMATGWWLSLRYGTNGGMAFKNNWDVVTGGEWLTMIAVVLIAFPLTVIGVHRDRRGDGPDLTTLVKWIEQQFDRRLKVRHRGLERRQALFWFVFGVNGYVTPLLAAGVAVIMVGISFCSWQNMGSAAQLFPMSTLLCVFSSIVTGMFIGHVNDDNTLGNYRSTLPVANTELAAAYLKATFLSCGACWAIWFVSMGIVSARFYFSGDLPQIMKELSHDFAVNGSLGARNVLLCLSAAILTSFALAGLTVSAFVTRAIFTLIVFHSIMYVIIIFVSLYAFIPDWRLMLQCVIQTMAGVACFAFTCVVNILAVRRQMIRWRTAGFNVACYAVMVVTLFGLVDFKMMNAATSSVMSEALMICGLMSLCFAPMSMAPLALAWNRHR